VDPRSRDHIGLDIHLRWVRLLNSDNLHQYLGGRWRGVLWCSQTASAWKRHGTSTFDRFVTRVSPLSHLPSTMTTTVLWVSRSHPHWPSYTSFFSNTSVSHRCLTLEHVQHDHTYPLTSSCAQSNGSALVKTAPEATQAHHEFDERSAGRGHLWALSRLVSASYSYIRYPCIVTTWQQSIPAHFPLLI
jgi:hypothetical protein